MAGASTVAGRLAFHFGVPIQTSMPSVTHLFPSPQRIAAAKFDEIGSLGITSQRAKTLIALAKVVSSGDLVLEPGRRIEGTLHALRQIPGIGNGPRSMSPCVRCRGPMRFPTPTSAFARHSEKPISKDTVTGRKVAAMAGLCSPLADVMGPIAFLIRHYPRFLSHREHLRDAYPALHFRRK